jgi:hypothetical protein
MWTFSAMPWLQGILAFIGVSTAAVLWRIPSRDHAITAERRDARG